MSPVQCKARLPLDYKLVGAERLRVSRHCIFLPSAFPIHSGGIRAGLSTAGTKDRRKASSRKTAGLHRCHPSPSSFEDKQREKEFCKSEQWHDSSWKKGTETEGNRGHLWSWLWFCSPEWTHPPAARPCPVLHFPAAEMHRSTEMKPQQSRWAREAGILCIFQFQCTQNKSV